MGCDLRCCDVGAGAVRGGRGFWGGGWVNEWEVGDGQGGLDWVV